MKWRLFENKIQQEVYHQEAEPNIDAFWAAIEPSVDAINARKRKRRGLIIWFFAGALLLSFGGSYFYMNNDSIPEIAILNQEHSINQENQLTISKNPASGEITVKDAAVNSENSTTKNVTQQTPSTQHKTQQYKKTESNNLAKTSAPTLASPQNSIESSTTIIPSKKEETATEKVNTKIEETATNIESKITDNIPTTESSPEVIINQDLAESEKIKTKTKIETETDIEIIEDQTEETKDNELPLPKDDKNISLAIAAQGGIGFSNRTLSTKSSNFENIKQLRDQSEEGLETVQGGLFLTFKHKKSNFSLTTGINYTQINERLIIDEVNVTNTMVHGIQALVGNLNGGVDTIWGDVPLDIITTIKKEHFNKYKMWEVPLLFGYQQSFSKWNFAIQTGVFANLKMKTEGEIFETDASFLDVEVEKIYRSNVGLSYYLGLSAAYQLSDDLEIYIAPSARFFPKDFTEQNYNLTQKYKIYGMNLGLRFLL